MLLLAGCGTGAVVFAPTPPPPDTSPLAYAHPGGAFSITVPRTWAMTERNTTTLASAAFTPPGAPAHALRVAVLTVDAPPTDADGINTLLNDYQTSIRPDASRYKEASREAMGDGSWRMTGLRSTPTGDTQQLNTFIEIRRAVVAVSEVIITADATLNTDLQTALNTLTLNTEAPLTPAPLNTLRFASPGVLTALNITPWTSDDGTFFLTGEVANYTDTPALDVPVRAVLLDANGVALAEAVDTAMGHGIAPGGFAPFSLRFGQGRPPTSTTFELFIGDERQRPAADNALVGAEVLEWTDEGTTTEAGWLVINGEVRNRSESALVYLPTVVTTVFDDAQRVIGAAYVTLDEPELEPGESVPFEVVIPELGGTPSRYILSVQGIP